MHPQPLWFRLYSFIQFISFIAYKFFFSQLWEHWASKRSMSVLMDLMKTEYHQKPSKRKRMSSWYNGNISSAAFEVLDSVSNKSHLFCCFSTGSKVCAEVQPLPNSEAFLPLICKLPAAKPSRRLSQNNNKHNYWENVILFYIAHTELNTWNQKGHK